MYLKLQLTLNRVIEDYPATSESAEALVGLKNVYVEAGDVRSYFDYVEGLSNVSVSASAQDSITFEAAEMLYAKGEHARAISAFGEYLQNFPQAVFKLSAHFYKAEALFALGKNEGLIGLFSCFGIQTKSVYGKSIESSCKDRDRATRFRSCCFTLHTVVSASTG